MSKLKSRRQRGSFCYDYLFNLIILDFMLFGGHALNRIILLHEQKLHHVSPGERLFILTFSFAAAVSIVLGVVYALYGLWWLCDRRGKRILERKHSQEMTNRQNR